MRTHRKSRGWHDWYAWHPAFTIDDNWVWLMWIERSIWQEGLPHFGFCTSYRFKNGGEVEDGKMGEIV